MVNRLDISNRIAVVIGGTSGIGQALAVGLAEHGATVVPSGRRSDRYPVDVNSRTSIDALRDAVLKEFGRVDILLNAAGYTMKQPSIQIAEDEWSALINTNLTGVLRTCQSFYEPLKASGHGRIVNIASLGSFLAFHQVAAYCASKSAVLALTKNLACEWAKDGICVNALVPGVFPTELNRKLIEGTPRGNEMIARTPMGRFGKAEELVGAAVLLSSDAASFITGESIAVDGGYLASGVNL